MLVLKDIMEKVKFSKFRKRSCYCIFKDCLKPSHVLLYLATGHVIAVMQVGNPEFKFWQNIWPVVLFVFNAVFGVRLFHTGDFHHK